MALVASALLNPVCNRVINFAIDEYQLVRNVEEEIEKLKSVASLIKGVLHDAEEKQVNEEAVRGWLRSLKQLLFSAEDILDEVATDAILQTRYADGSEPVMGMGGKVRNIICCFGLVDRISSKHAIAHQINAIRLKLDDMYKARNGLGLQISWPVESRPTRPHTSSLLADESYIMGRDDEREKIINLLLGSEEDQETESASRWQNNIRVLTITGMGGVGKTTLAKLVFNDSRVKQHFQLMMWVCVSEDFDLRRITREMSEVAFPSEEKKELFELSNWDLLQKRFKNKIQDRKFLLVLDDLWEEDHGKWETLCEPLMSGGKGSRIVVTTRQQRTLNMVNGTAIPLKVMSSEELWPIFKRYAFGDHHESGEMIQLEIVGRQIVEKLKGLPLAAKVIGRLLSESLDIEHWADILRSERFALQPQPSNSILPILKLSYDHLSMNSKQCFAYCSLFPKDDIFFKDKLVQMWMAQNFIQSIRADFHVEKAGHEIFDGLVYKSLLEKCKVRRVSDHLFEGLKSWFLDVSEELPDACTMHDLIHDLAESVAEDDCLRLGDKHIEIPAGNVYHVSIATKNVDVAKMKKLSEFRNLRTLLFLRRSTLSLTHYLDELCMKLKRLRVLGLQGCRIQELPSSIGKLKHLRFMDLSDNLISTLPETCSELHNLQVLNLEDCRWLGALPRSTSALVNLRHLQVDTEVVSTVQGLGKLTALQELIVTGSKVRELADMGMLRRLRIWCLDGVVSKEEAIQARLEAKEHLQVLELRWSDNHQPCSTPQHYSVSDEEVVDALQPVNSIRLLLLTNYQGVKSPRWMDDPSWVSTSFLERVVLENCKKWEVLPPLGQLRCLKFLRIHGMPGVELIGPQFCEVDGGTCGGDKLPGFPSLEELQFRDLPTWKEWKAPPPSQPEGDGRDLGQQQPAPFLPRLRVLRIIRCPELRELPPLPTTLTDLWIVEVGLIHLPGWMGWPGGGGGGGDGGNFDAATSSSSPSSPSLSSLWIWGCTSLTCLGGGLLQHPPPTLKRLHIWGLYELTSLPDGQVFRHLTSLESLTMIDCPKLSWPRSATGEDALPPSLQQVEIQGCGDMIMTQLLLPSLSKLTSLSRLEMDVGYPKTVVAVAGLQLTSLRHLGIKGGNNHVDDRALSTCLGGGVITSLNSLSISNCSAVTTALPPEEEEEEEALSRLPSLQRLDVSNCTELRSLGFSSHSLLSVEEIQIDNCPKLLYLANEYMYAATSPASPAASSSPPPPPPPPLPPQMLTRVKDLSITASSPEQIRMWLRQCPSLQKLVIQDCPQLIACFDDDGVGDDDINIHQLAPFLRALCIWRCENLRSLPSSLRSLSSLEYLHINWCPQIQRLPSAGLPETLEDLDIHGCPELADRCRKEGCPDWPLISHIPRVKIED